jgi:cytochrome c oxidase cbb3-type subunit 3
MKNLPLEDQTTQKDGSTKIKLGLTALLFLPFQVFGQDVSGSGMSQETLVTWLILIVIVIAILVLMVAIYTLSVLKVALNQETEPETVTAEKKSTWVWDRFNKSVPQEQEASILLDHNYDGIRELDNHLPPWWTAFFYFSIVFGVIYMFVYHVFNIAPLPGELYDISIAEAKTASAAKLAEDSEGGEGIDESTVVFSDAAAVLGNGKKIYDMQCASCHRNDGGGGIGPNLTDSYWLHGGSVGDIFTSVKYGIPQKGMISWEPLLSPEQMSDVTSYIISMEGSNPPDAKSPQGDLYQAEEESTTSQSEESGSNSDEETAPSGEVS